jgi:drug/metabolite transporter (DMT)-like permease
MTALSESTPYLGETLALMTAITWAFAVIMFKKSGETVHPVVLNLFKGFLGFVLLIPTAYLFGQNLLRAAPVNEYLLLIASGFIGIGVADTFYFKSLNRMAAGIVAIIACLYSPTIIVLSVIFLDETLTLIQIVGALLIIVAVLTGVNRRGLENVTRNDLFWGMLFGMIGVVANGTGIVMVKQLLERSPLLWVTEVRLLAGCVSLALVLLAFPKRRQMLASLFSMASWKYTFFGSFFGTYVAMVLWLGGMKYTQASIASVLNQTSNIFIVILAALILKERITWHRAVGIGLAVTGAIMVSFG